MFGIRTLLKAPWQLLVVLVIVTDRTNVRLLGVIGGLARVEGILQELLEEGYWVFMPILLKILGWGEVGIRIEHQAAEGGVLT